MRHANRCQRGDKAVTGAARVDSSAGQILLTWQHVFGWGPHAAAAHSAGEATAAGMRRLPRYSRHYSRFK
jgi:hypothetical protein